MDASLNKALKLSLADAGRQALSSKSVRPEKALVVGGSSWVADVLGIKEIIQNFVKTIFTDEQSEYLRMWLAETLSIATGLYLADMVGQKPDMPAGSRQGKFAKFLMVAGIDVALAYVVSEKLLPQVDKVI